VLDLGCGSGALTAQLHETLGAQRTLGVDRSQAMLEGASTHELQGLEFLEADIADVAKGSIEPCPEGAFDVVFSNAALH